MRNARLRSVSPRSHSRTIRTAKSSCSTIRAKIETAAIVADLVRRHPNVRLFHGGELPSNWHGKAYACAQLAKAASGDWLLFVDADAVLAPQCVSVTLRQAHERHADLLTMIPTSLGGGFGEALLLPIVPLTFVTFLPLGL